MLKSNAYNYIFNWGLIITCLHDAVVYWLSNLVTADSEINWPMNNYPPRISDKNLWWPSIIKNSHGQTYPWVPQHLQHLLLLHWLPPLHSSIYHTAWLQHEWHTNIHSFQAFLWSSYREVYSSMPSAEFLWTKMCQQNDSSNVTQLTFVKSKVQFCMVDSYPSSLLLWDFSFKCLRKWGCMKMIKL